MGIVYYIVIEVFRCIKKTLYLFFFILLLPIFFFLHFPEPNIGKKNGMDDLEFWVHGKKTMVKMIRAFCCGNWSHRRLVQGTFLIK